MEMSDIYWEWQRKTAETKFSNIDGDAFEHEVQSIFKGLWGDDFSPTLPMGSWGDLKCDGYRRSTATVYQCYGPRNGRVNVSEALNKIREDFRSARDHWKDDLKEWKFVVNVYKDKLPAALVREISLISREIGVTAGPIDRSDLLELIRSLPDIKRAHLYGKPPTPSVNNHAIHDVHLYTMMTNLLESDGLIKFLEEQDMGFGHQISRIRNLWRFADEWGTPSSRFIDEAMDEMRSKMVDEANNYRRVHCRYMSLDGDKYIMNSSPGTDPELDQLEFERLAKIKSHIHSLADQFVRLYADFVHMGKLRLPLNQ